MANPQAWGGNYTGYQLYFNVSRSSNPAANQSTFTWSAYIYATAVNYKPFNLNVTSTAVGYIGGNLVLNQTFSYDFRTAVANTIVKNFNSGTLTVNHDSAGNLPTQYAYATVTLQGNPGTATADSYIAGADYDRSPTWIDSDASGSVTRGQFFSNSVSANAASGYSLLEGGFPPGIGLSGGTVSGTATTVGSYSFRLRANGSFEGSVDTGWQTITVNPALPVFSDGSVNSSARVGIAYSDGVSASETSSYSVVAAPNSLPPGLNLNTSNGTITGTPTTPGSYSFRIRASNSTGSTDTAVQTVTVISAARVWNGSAFVSGLANVWNGSSFVSGTIRVWNGSAWVNTN
jgi:hypothetical protein